MLFKPLFKWTNIGPLSFLNQRKNGKLDKMLLIIDDHYKFFCNERSGLDNIKKRCNYLVIVLGKVAFFIDSLENFFQLLSIIVKALAKENKVDTV